MGVCLNAGVREYGFVQASNSLLALALALAGTAQSITIPISFCMPLLFVRVMCAFELCEH